jgi:hypothetical protein
MLHAVLLAAALASPEPTVAPQLIPAAVPTGTRTAQITNSGSTNRAGYTITVSRNGRTALQQGAFPIRRTISARLASRFFADLQAAGDVAKLPDAHCMKSVSFGTSTHVAYRGSVSPDISCPSTSPHVRALEDDVQAIAQAAGVSMMPGPQKPFVP